MHMEDWQYSSTHFHAQQ